MTKFVKNKTANKINLNIKGKFICLSQREGFRTITKRHKYAQKIIITVSLFSVCVSHMSREGRTSMERSLVQSHTETTVSPTGSTPFGTLQNIL